MQDESYDAVSERHGCVVSDGRDHLIFAEVPNDDFARAIVTFGEGSLEEKVVDRVVIDTDREALYLRIFAGPLRHRPRDKNGSNFQSEVIVEASSLVFLDPESESRGPGRRCRVGYDWGDHADKPSPASAGTESAISLALGPQKSFEQALKTSLSPAEKPS